MFSIGEFSKVTGLTVKTLRFYQEQGLLRPTCVEDLTGYRYYDASLVERARVIVKLRELEFSIAEIAAILQGCEDDVDILTYLKQRRDAVESSLAHSRQLRSALTNIIATTLERREIIENSPHVVRESVVEPMLIAGIRMKGRYGDCGKAFASIGRRFGRHVCGSPLLLFYDDEYRDEDADFEVCMPVRKGSSVDGISVRELAGGCAVSLIHHGPYDDCGRSYEKLFAFMKRQDYTPASPCREIYLKGPGIIFKGNPKKYVTEIQVPIKLKMD
jgi:DNA-binding transcriptional MerR regulator/effector-binding domain-containing protein